MSSTRSNFCKKEKAKKSKLKVTVSHNEESCSPIFPPSCLRPLTKCRKKTRPVRRCIFCKCKKPLEDACEKSILPALGKGMKMYLDRLNEFGVTHCKCHRPKNCCCRCHCALLKQQPITQSVVYPKQRPISQKVCFIDDPPYTLPKKNQGSHPSEDHCKQCCSCCHIVPPPRKNPRIDVWCHLPEIAVKSSLREHPPEGQRWDDVPIKSAALCRAALNVCEAEARFRCRLPSWVHRY